MTEMRVIGIQGIGAVRKGDSLAEVVLSAMERQGLVLAGGDIIVVAQKIVSKAEDRVVRLADVEPSDFAVQAAEATGRDPRLVEVVLREARRVVRMDRRALIVETKHGWVCANAGVDESNVAGGGVVTLLPVNPDLSARRLRAALAKRTGVDTAVIISDTFGRPWREGLTNVAIGLAGMLPVLDYRGQVDECGYLLKGTSIAVADELASAAELVMGKLERVPVALIRGYDYPRGDGRARQMVRPRTHDLFR